MSGFYIVCMYVPNFSTTFTHCFQDGNLEFNKTMVDNYCSNLWRYFDRSDNNLPLPEIHLTFIIGLFCLFLLSTIEGLVESYYKWAPYCVLYRFDPLPCPQSGHSRDKPVKQLKINEIEMMQIDISNA